MKKNLFIILLMLVSATAWSQESAFTLSGGWASASPENSSSSASGYRINGLYEFNPNQGKISHGFNVGYVRTTATQTTSIGINNSITSTATIRSWPVFYAPKIMFGNSEKFKFFLKGALGWQFGGYKVESPSLTLETNDSGFYGGLGAGGMLNLNENLFLNLEYEWAYVANMYYGNGYLNTAQLGVGYRF